MSEATKLAWAAGFVDGEACLCVSKCTHKKKAHHRESMTAVLTLSHVQRPPIDELHRLLGGKVAVGKDEYGQFFVWRAFGSELARILERILPYLVNKKKQAELLLEFQSTVSLRKNKHGKGGRFDSVSDETYEYRLSIWAALKVLNRKRSRAERLSAETPDKTHQEDAIVRTAVNEEAAEAGRNDQPPVIQ